MVGISFKIVYYLYLLAIVIHLIKKYCNFS